MKQKPSKLDAYAERLDEWFSGGMTLDQAKEQLRLDGCSVSRSRLGEWWSARLQGKQEDALLRQIATGARQCQEVERELGKNPAPDMNLLMGLHRVLILKLTTGATNNPEMLELVNRMMKPVIQFARLKQLGEQIALDRDKFQFDAAKMCMKQLPMLKAIVADKSLTDDQRIEQIRMKLFGVATEGTESTEV